MITVTENAASQIHKLLEKQQLARRRPARRRQGGRLLRVSSTCSPGRPRRGRTIRCSTAPNGVRVLVDPRSHRLLDGTTLDYDTSLLSRGFHVPEPARQEHVRLRARRSACRLELRKPTSMTHTSTETIEELATREYKYGFVTDVEADTVPRGLNEDVVRLISAKKGEPEWLLEWRLKAYRAWLTMKEPTWPNVQYDPIDYQDISLLLGAEAEGGARRAWTRSIPRSAQTFEKLGIPLEEQKLLAGVAVDAVFDSVSVATTFKEKLAELGIIFCSFSEAVQRASGPGAEVPRLGRALHGQLLRGAQLGGLQRRLVLLHPEGRALPDGAVHLLPHQRAEHRPVRAHADRRRRGRVRQLPRGLHGADARREPAARGGGRAGRARQRDDQVLDGPELVSRATRRARAASTTS